MSEDKIMDNSLNYADLIKKTLQSLQAIRIYPMCDRDSGHFLILATGWDKQCGIPAFKRVPVLVFAG